jgi:hypothetical protein
MTTTEFQAAIQAAVTAANNVMTLSQFQAAVNAAVVLPSTNTLTQWMASIQAAVTASAATVQTVKMGYLHELMTGQTLYDVLLIIPPKYEIATPRNWNSKEFTLTWYLIRQNKGATLDLMTDAERLAAWSALDVVNKAIIVQLQSSPTTFQIDGIVEGEYNSGSPSQLLPDNVIWLETSFKCRISDC